MKYTFATAALVILATPSADSACTVGPSAGRGLEIRREFVVQVSYDHKPLAGVTVVVTAGIEGGDKLFSGKTGPDGTVRVLVLPPGDYWLKATLLGVFAGTDCFHVEHHATRNAKRVVKYEWGDLALSAKSISGKLVESLPGKGEDPLLNRFRRIDSPIPRAKLTLINASTLERYIESSDQDGAFLFDQVPDGTYVLRIEGGTLQNGPSGEATNQVIKINKTATRDRFLFRLGGPPGSCGGWSLE